MDLYEELAKEKVYHDVKFDGKTFVITNLNKYQADQINELFNKWEQKDFEKNREVITDQIKDIEVEMYSKMNEDRINRCVECGVETTEKETDKYHGVCKTCFNG